MNRVCLFLIAILFIFFTSCTSKKQLKLKDKVEVLRDKHGINHIYANNQQDLFLCKGIWLLKTDFFNLKYGEGKLQELLQKFLVKLN